MILVAILFGSVVGMTVGLLGYIAFGLSLFAAVSLYLFVAIIPAVLSSFSLMLAMLTEADTPLLKRS